MTAGTARHLFAALTVAVLGGCWRAEAREPRSPPAAGIEHTQWTNFFVFGALGEESFDVREVCPSGAASVRTGGNAATVLVSVVTLFVYTPRVINVQCAATAEARER